MNSSISHQPRSPIGTMSVSASRMMPIASGGDSGAPDANPLATRGHRRQVAQRRSADALTHDHRWARRCVDHERVAIAALRSMINETAHRSCQPAGMSHQLEKFARRGSPENCVESPAPSSSSLTSARSVRSPFASASIFSLGRDAQRVVADLAEHRACAEQHDRADDERDDDLDEREPPSDLPATE